MEVGTFFHQNIVQDEMLFYFAWKQCERISRTRNEANSYFVTLTKGSVLALICGPLWKEWLNIK